MTDLGTYFFYTKIISRIKCMDSGFAFMHFLAIFLAIVVSTKLEMKHATNVVLAIPLHLARSKSIENYLVHVKCNPLRTLIFKDFIFHNMKIFLWFIFH